MRRQTAAGRRGYPGDQYPNAGTYVIHAGLSYPHLISPPFRTAIPLGSGAQWLGTRPWRW